jgi:hypothetical protein
MNPDRLMAELFGTVRYAGDTPSWEDSPALGEEHDEQEETALTLSDWDESKHPRGEDGKFSDGDGAGRAKIPASWNEPSDNPFARGMTRGQVILDWLHRNKIEQRGDKFVMYHATPASNTFTTLKPGSYLASDPETATQQARRDRGPGVIRVHEVEFYPWEISHSSVWAITKSDIPLGKKIVKPRSKNLSGEWNEALHPRDDHGRFADGDGDSYAPRELLPHTKDSHHQYNPVAGFVMEHLGPFAGIGPHAPTEGVSLVGEKYVHVYVGTVATVAQTIKRVGIKVQGASRRVEESRKAAFKVAKTLGDHLKANPLVVELRIPDSLWGTAVKDEPPPPRVTQDIPPDWVRGMWRAVGGDWHPFQLTADGEGRTVYLVVLAREQATSLFDPDQPRDEAGRWTAAGASGGGDDRYDPATMHITASPQFKRWFKDSKVVDPSGDPLVVYHGTTHAIDSFYQAGHEKLNPESDWGAGVYFTSEPEDADANYAGVGPDLKGKIEKRAEELSSERRSAPGYEYPDDDTAENYEDRQKAREELVGSAGALMIPAYLSIQKPFVIGEPNGSSDIDETRLFKEYKYDDPDDPDSDIIGEEGPLADVFEALRHVASQYDEGPEAYDAFVENVGYEESMTASDIVKAWRGTEKAAYISDDRGNLVTNEVLREALQRAGFDGVIDRTVDDKFGSGSGRSKPMKGMNPDTTHYIVFEPTQIKSATGNKTFDPNRSSIHLRHEFRLGWCIACRVPQRECVTWKQGTHLYALGWCLTCHVPRYDCDWNEADHPRDEAGRFTDGSGEASTNDAGDRVAPETFEHGREFTSEDGYEWHEKGPGGQWAKRVATDEDLRVISDYAGFGYGDINKTLRGNPPTQTAMIRPMTKDEIAAYERWTREEDAAPEKEPHPPEGQGHAYRWDWTSTYIKGDDLTREQRYIVTGPKVWEERRLEAEKQAAQLNDTIRDRGLVLDEPVTVYRASYLPGVTKSDLESRVGKTFEEPGFTSTMLGDAGGRLKGYVVWGKYESISNRFGTASGTLSKHQDEDGVAMRIKIALPKGTRVAAVEAARQEDRWRSSARTAKQYGWEHKPPQPDQIKDARTESEVLIGSGARFRITKVGGADEVVTSGDPTLKPVRIIDVEMEYVGGGSSDGHQ